MPAFDVYGPTDTLPDEIVDVVAARLENRGQHPAFRRMLTEYLDVMSIDRATSVLDFGCGTGVAARAIAARPDFRGTVTGVDLSPRLVAAASQLAASEGLAGRVRFAVGNAEGSGLPAASFDAAVAHTLVSHVPDPAAVLAEMRRVVRPGGMIGVFDGDYASITFGQPDPVQGKADDEAIQRAIVTNPRVMRQMPSLLRSAGLTLVAGFPSVVADLGTADFWRPAIASFRRIVPQSGAMDEAAVNAWADARLRESDAGEFFGASNYYAYVARRD